MKRWGNILNSSTITIEFCKDAIYESALHKHKRIWVKKIIDNIDYYAIQIQYMLLNDTFKPNKYGYELRMERGKLRKLQKPVFYPDQIIHHALIMLIRERLFKRLDHYALASIPTRGQHPGIRHIKSWLKNDKQNTKYCLKCDIKKCFENVLPHIIIKEFKKFIKDRRWLDIFAVVVNSAASLPLGNYMSAWILNILLMRLDRMVRSNYFVSHYVRYMDDFLIFSSDKDKLHELVDRIKNSLSEIKLELKHNYQVYNIDKQGIDMLGYRFYRNNTLMRKRNLKSLYKQINKISKMKFIPISACQSISSIVGQLKYCNSKKLYTYIRKTIDIDKIKNIISDSDKILSGNKIDSKYILIKNNYKY